MLYQVSHNTTYRYSAPVTISHHSTHLAPRNAEHQTCLHARLEIFPAPAVLKTRTDFYGNHTSFFTIQEPHSELSVQHVSRVEVLPGKQPIPSATTPWNKVRDELGTLFTEEDLDACNFAQTSPLIPYDLELAEYARPDFPAERPILEAARALTSRIHKEFIFDPTATNVSTPLREVLQNRRGVCQDFAHLQIGCLRALGLPARYVSGYVRTFAPEGQSALIGADASHAWLSVYVPQHGWVDLDPTNDLIPTTEHITVAWGRDYSDVSPVRGVFFGGGQHLLFVGVDVRPLDPQFHVETDPHDTDSSHQQDSTDETIPQESSSGETFAANPRRKASRTSKR